MLGRKLNPIPAPMAVCKPKYNYSGNVVNGNLCKECSNSKNCKDKHCPVYKWRVIK